MARRPALSVVKEGGVGFVPGVTDLIPVTGGSVALLDTAPGYARLIADTDSRQSLALICEIGDNAPRVTSGYATWSSVPRPGRRALSRFDGYEPLEIEIELFLDSFNADAVANVEQSILVLEGMAGRGSLAPPDQQPPPLILDTAGVVQHDRVLHPSSRWVITDLQWDDDAVIRNDAGDRLRAPVTVQLREHVTDARLADRALAAAQRLKSRNTGSRKTVTAKKGDTLISIARDRLGDGGRWQELARLNDIRDPHSLKAGQKVRLP